MKNRKNRFLILIVLIFSLFVLMSLNSVSAATFHDNENSSIIQDVITNKDSENEIILEGNFNNMQNINITCTMTIKGNGAIIQGSGSGTLFNVRTTYVIIENLSITGFSAAVNFNMGNVIIRNNVF